MDCLNRYFEAFFERFKVMYIEATKLEEAFIIFETLNSRGKDLETADLLKNFVFSKSKDVDDTQKKWNSIVDNLDKLIQPIISDIIGTLLINSFAKTTYTGKLPNSSRPL